MLRALLPVCVCLGTIIPYTTSKVYRTDYEYNEKTDAFYKLHTETLNYWETRSKCEIEGASLMLPTSNLDVVVVHAMFKTHINLSDYVWVHNDDNQYPPGDDTGILNMLPEYELPSDPTWRRRCDVLTRDGQEETFSCSSLLPFVCKVAAKDVPYNQECDVHVVGYERAPNGSSCYKVSKIALRWAEAEAFCAAEGAHLVVINSQEEHDYVKDLMNVKPSVVSSTASWFYIAGFRAKPTTDSTTRVFITVLNQTLEEAGYNKWAEGEPNNAKGKENCGSLFKNDGYFNDVDCSKVLGFICEKDLPV